MALAGYTYQINWRTHHCWKPCPTSKIFSCWWLLLPRSVPTRVQHCQVWGTMEVSSRVQGRFADIERPWNWKKTTDSGLWFASKFSVFPNGTLALYSLESRNILLWQRELPGFDQIEELKTFQSTRFRETSWGYQRAFRESDIEMNLKRILEIPERCSSTISGFTDSSK